MPVQRAQCDLVEIYEAQLGATRSRQSGGSMGPDTAAADDDDEGLAEFVKPGIGQEDSIACQLLQDQIFGESVRDMTE